MTYENKINQSVIKGHYYSIATKILDSMAKLRLDENNNSPRRWIWELIQNAKDVAYENSNISIEINFRENRQHGILEFKHNGRPFSVDNLTFLIEQVSTKERNVEKTAKVKTTGKFGTGFLTTHLLSEIVEVESVLKEQGEPYRKFKLLIDRSSRDIDGIIDSVNNSLDTLKKIDENPPFTDFSPDSLNTIFRYELNENGINVAEMGLDDLKKSLIYTLVFLPNIKYLKLENEDKVYELSRDSYEELGDIKIYTVAQYGVEEKSETKIALLTKNDTSIAVEIEYRDNQIFLRETDPSVPRLFCDFPLVGSDTFPFPVIINSAAFNPNEPRSGVYLTDTSEEIVAENRAIISDALDLYFTLLEFASTNNWGNIFLLAKTPKVIGKEWFSKRWAEESIIEPIREKLFKTPVVDTEKHGRVSIVDQDNNPTIWFPYSSKKIIREKIWDLANSWMPSMLPRKGDIDIWFDILGTNCNQLSLDEITRKIQDMGGVNNLTDMLVLKTDPLEWLNEYYDLLNLEDEFINHIIADKYTVIPNQNGAFKKRSSLVCDLNIDEELKNVLSILNDDPREYLLNRRVKTGRIDFSSMDQAGIVEKINKIIMDGVNEKIDRACDYMITLFSDANDFPEEREMIYQFYKKVFPDFIGEKRKINVWDLNIWKEVDKRGVKRIAESLSEARNVLNLTQKYNFNNAIDTIDWLNGYISFLANQGFEHYLNHRRTPILPNQNGDFTVKDDLFLDDGGIDEVLKDISFELGRDFRKELLDLNIFLELPQNRTMSQVHVAEEIARLANKKITEHPRSDQTKSIFRKLYIWFNENKENAAAIFGELYNNKHKLYDDEEIAETFQKAEMISEILGEFEIDDITALRKALQAIKFNNFFNKQDEINERILVSLGITSIDELEEALKDTDFAAQFTHTSTPTVEMFLRVQGLIDRSIKNVIEHLKNHDEYDCTDLELLSRTVLGGITRNGLPIYVVVRPSDNGEVIIYYRSEKDSLDFANSELWIDNGKEVPKHLTLGKILKNTGINRIPVEK